MTNKEKLGEDKIRDRAREILGFYDTETAQSDVGQITTFNDLGFSGVKDRPDGWYFPNEKSFPAIILEVKSNSTVLKQSHIDELLKNCKIAHSKYQHVIGILYNGDDTIVFKDEVRLTNETSLHNKEHYLSLYNEDTIDKQKIFNLTKRINDSLHFEFGIKNLNHRMIFTACALVAKRYGATLVKGMDYATFHTSIHSTLSKSLEEAKKQNQKLDLLLEVYSEIKMNIPNNQEAIDEFIDNVSQISDNINSDFWRGEDVMAIFFNEFNRYKGKSEQGQVFTPDHITSLIYRITETTKNDIVLDAACGSGAFLVKSMCNMVKEAGGTNTSKARKIKDKQLYGIEKDREIFALACANMLIHKDGKTNLEQLDSRYTDASKWIKSKQITKVLMNPPFEKKYGCIDIISNVLNSVAYNENDEGKLTRQITCAFILPDRKLEKDSKQKVKKILKNHTLQKIIKLPEKVFEGVTTSIFVFKTGIPQNNQEIFSCFIEDDGLETVKNQGRQDIRKRWQDIEDKWVDIIHKQSGDDTIQWINPNEHLSYQVDQKQIEICEEDFIKTMMDYELFKRNINQKVFGEKLLKKVLYGSQVKQSKKNTIIALKGEYNE
ncbi:MAG: N-6 DNA methylase [Bacteroidales bacterium]|nr:N-6 DNA methylase [Bacteroidales bacterium]